MKYSEIIADNLSKAGWSWGWVSAVDCNGRTISIADTHREATASAAVLCGTSALGNRSNVVNNMRIVATAVLILLTLGLAQAEPRHREHKDNHHNYIIERQQAYQVQGPPTSRLIIGKREIDIYRLPNNGGHIMFEGNNVVGITR